MNWKIIFRINDDYDVIIMQNQCAKDANKQRTNVKQMYFAILCLQYVCPCVWFFLRLFFSPKIIFRAQEWGQDNNDPNIILYIYQIYVVPNNEAALHSILNIFFVRLYLFFLLLI